MKTIYSRILGISMIIIMTFHVGQVLPQSYVSTGKSESGKRQYSFSDTFTDYEVQAKGDIRVNDDDTRIVSISPGGYLKISKKTFGNKRSVIIESNSSGELSYEYYEGRTEVPFEPEGRKWLADVLLDVVRMSGIDVKGRTKRIYTGKGIDGFLEEVHAIPSNSISGLYFDELLGNYNLKDDELVSVCRAIAGEISSNSERGRLYREHSSLFLGNNMLAVVFFESVAELSSITERGSILRSLDHPIDFNDPGVTGAYFNGIDRLSSNTEAGSVLRQVEQRQSLSKEASIRLLESVRKLSSNTEMGSVMRSLNNLEMSDPQVMEAWFDALDAMTSNTEAGSTVRDLIGRYPANEAMNLRLLESVRKLTSNTEAGSVLRSIDDLNLENQKVSAAYFSTVARLTGNTEKGAVLRYAIGKYPLNSGSWVHLFNATGSLSSNTEMGSVLGKAVETMPYEKEVLDNFFITANKMTSNTEKGRVLREAASSPSVNREAVIGIIRSSAIMTSNTEKSSVLRTVAGTSFINDEEVKSAYMDAARTLTSDSEYRTVVDAILND